MTETALFANLEARTIRGLLLPFGELSAPSVSKTPPVMFAPAVVELPADPSVVTANENHSQHEPRGRAITLEETPAGIVAEFAIARTPEGDDLLARAADPDPTKRPRLSAELKDLVHQGARVVKAKLTGAAFVPQGAFASAALFAIAPDEAETIRAAVNEAVAAALAAHTEPQTPSDSPSPDNPQGDIMNAAAAAPAAAVVPDGLNPPADPAPVDTTSATGLFAALAYAGRTKDKSVLAPYAGMDALFAISTVQNDGPSGRTIAADTRVPQALGELWKRRRYQRKFIPLFNQEVLTALRITAWRWTVEPEMDDYAGNVAEIPSNAIDTEPVGKDARRLAGGHKLDRRYTDFGDTTVYASYLDKMTESYSRKSDLRILADAVAAATPKDVAALEIPAGVAAGLTGIVDGALAVIESENTPSFSIVSPELWRDIVLTGKNEVLGYLTASLGLEGGDMEGFRILPGPVGAGKVLTGAREALTVYELGGGAPIRVEGLDPHHGAIDPAMFGYVDSIVEAAAALAIVDTALYGTAE